MFPGYIAILTPPAAQHIIDRDADYFAADSDLLGECVEFKRPLTELSAAECLDHFMSCRFNEMQFVANEPLAAALAELRQTSERLAEIGPLEYQKYALSLDRWRAALAADADWSQ